MPSDATITRPVVLVTGASRLSGIGAAVAERLARDGWDVAITYWTAYDERMPWGSQPDEIVAITDRCRALDSRAAAVEADLTDVASTVAVFDIVERELGTVDALVMCHCESVDSDIRTTTVESSTATTRSTSGRRGCSSASSRRATGTMAMAAAELSRSRAITRSATFRTG